MTETHDVVSLLQNTVVFPNQNDGTKLKRQKSSKGFFSWISYQIPTEKYETDEDGFVQVYQIVAK